MKKMKQLFWRFFFIEFFISSFWLNFERWNFNDDHDFTLALIPIDFISIMLVAQGQCDQKKIAKCL